MALYEDNSLSIGQTPLVRLKGLVPEGVKVYAKIEGRNPAYSVKCRIGAAMIWDAEKRGVLRPGMTIVEPTSGNTGIALCYVAAARGYKFWLLAAASTLGGMLMLGAEGFAPLFVGIELLSLPALVKGAREHLHLGPEATGFVLPLCTSLFKMSTMTAEHDFMSAFGRLRPKGERDEMRERYPLVEHPVAPRHEATGRRYLYVNRYFTSRILGVSDAESIELIEMLSRQADYPEYQCRYRWQNDSVAFWDNRAVQHYAASDYWPEKRVMERASVIGKRPSV